MSQMRTQAAANAAAQASAAGESAKEVTAKAKAAAKDAAAQAQATTQDTAGKAQAKSEGVWQKVRCCDAALPALHEAVSVKAHDMRNSIRRSGLSSALSKQAWCFNAGVCDVSGVSLAAVAATSACGCYLGCTASASIPAWTPALSERMQR